MLDDTQILVTEDSFTEKCCLYVRSYLHAKKLKIGEYWLSYEYMEWIGDKHQKFKKDVLKRKGNYYAPYSLEEAKMFKEYLFSTKE